jgi:uncharacterized protein DUF6869
VTDDRSADLVTTWLRHCRVSADAHLLDRLVRYNAETGWRLILAVHLLSSDPDVPIWRPVESSLRYHGDAVINRIVELASRDASFRNRLSLMQHGYGIRDDLLRRVGDVCGWTPRPSKNQVIKRAEKIVQVDINPPVTTEAWSVIDAERSDNEILTLAQAWIEAASLFWAFDEVGDAIRDRPIDDVWMLILALVARADAEALGSVAAGPLEDFLARHGDGVIALVEKQARDDPKFRVALRGVWRSGMPDDVWARVLAARRAGTSD